MRHGSEATAPIVIGVGNDFRRDDGAGPAVVWALHDGGGLPDGVRLAWCDGEPTRMIDLWDGSRLAIVVDAAAPDPANGLSPGGVLRWEHGCGTPGWSVRSEASGSHALGPGAALELARVLDREPRRLIVLAVVGAYFDFGAGLSAPVASAVGRVVDRIRGELALEAAARPPGPETPTAPAATCDGTTIEASGRAVRPGPSGTSGRVPSRLSRPG